MTYPSFGDSSGIFPIYLGETVVEITDAVSNAFAFTQTATHNFIYEDVSNTFTWTLNRVQMEAIVVLAADRLFYFGLYTPEGQDAQHNYFYQDAANAFSWEDVSGYDQELSVTQYLNLTPRYFAPNLANTLFLSEDTVKIATSAAVENTFAWIDHENPDVWPRALHRTFNIENAFSWSSIVAGGDVQTVYDDLAFADVVDSSGSTYERDAGELGLKDSVSFKITGSRCVEKEFSPYVGAGTDDFPAFSATAPTLSTGVLTLTYPRVGPSLTVILKNPVFGNVDSLNYPKIDRTTLGGERVVFSDPTWGASQVLTMTIENICSPDIDDLLTFLNASLGKEIGLADWEGRNWAGVIVAPQTEIGKTVTGWRLQLVFEGELV